MEREKFYEFVNENIRDVLPVDFIDATFKVQDINKTSGSYTGLVMQKPNLQITPTLNLDAVYDTFPSDPNRGLSECASIIKEQVDKILNGDMKQIVDKATKMTDYNNVKDLLFVAPINEKRGIAMPDVPQQDIEGMHFVAKIQFSADKNGVAAAVVKQSHMDAWGIDKGQLFHDAWENMVKIRPGKLYTLPEMLTDMMGDLSSADPALADAMSDMQPPMYIYTNEMRTDGAAALFAGDALDEVAEEMKCDGYYMFPSSIHECILVPDGVFAPGALEEMKEMIAAGNATISNPGEILSDTPYHYDAYDRVFEKAEEYMAKIGALQEGVVEEYEINLPNPSAPAMG